MTASSANAPPHTWEVFEPSRPILTYTYSFGPGTATSLAVGGEDGLIVFSPPCNVDPGAFEDLARYGEVRALVASNAFHHMGLAEWKRRFPNAHVFAPAQAIERVERRSGLTGIRPLSDAAPIAGAGLELTDMPHYKTGEALVRIGSARGRVWYVTDIVLNLPELPKHLLIRTLFKLTGSAPGLKLNNLGPRLFMVKDMRALKRWLAAELEKTPPRWLIPTHGEIIDFGTNIEPARRIFT